MEAFATNELATKNPAESGPRICNRFFFFFEREKKEEDINLQPCLMDYEIFFFETEEIRIRRMVFLVVICTNKRTIERISRGKI